MANIDVSSLEPQYSDLSRLFDADDSGDLKVNEDAQAIQGSLLNIFLTRKGERKHRLQFGTPLRDLKHDLMSETFAVDVREAIRDGFSQEPRAKLKDFSIDRIPEEYSAVITIVWGSPKLIEQQKTKLLLEQS